MGLSFQRLGLTLIVGMVWTFCGCESQPAALPVPPPAPPITVDEWRLLDVDEKYAPETFERLQQSDPQLQTAEGWDQFMRDVVVPSRKVDLPENTPPGAM